MENGCIIRGKLPLKYLCLHVPAAHGWETQKQKSFTRPSTNRPMLPIFLEPAQAKLMHNINLRNSKLVNYIDEDTFIQLTYSSLEDQEMYSANKDIQSIVPIDELADDEMTLLMFYSFVTILYVDAIICTNKYCYIRGQSIEPSMYVNEKYPDVKDMIIHELNKLVH